MTEDNKENLEVYKKLWNEVKKQIECNSVECNSFECNTQSTEWNSIEYEKDTMKIKFDASDEDLPLNKILRFSDLNMIIESVSQIKDPNSYS